MPRLGVYKTIQPKARHAKTFPVAPHEHGLAPPPGFHGLDYDAPRYVYLPNTHAPTPAVSYIENSIAVDPVKGTLPSSNSSGLDLMLILSGRYLCAEPNSSLELYDTSTNAPRDCPPFPTHDSSRRKLYLRPLDKIRTCPSLMPLDFDISSRSLAISIFSPQTRVLLCLGAALPLSYIHVPRPAGRSPPTSINNEPTFLPLDTITLRSSSRRAIPVYRLFMYSTSVRPRLCRETCSKDVRRATGATVWTRVDLQC